MQLAHLQLKLLCNENAMIKSLILNPLCDESQEFFVTNMHFHRNYIMVRMCSLQPYVYWGSRKCLKCTETPSALHNLYKSALSFCLYSNLTVTFFLML